MDLLEFQSSLDQSRAWRKLELSSARSLAENYSGRSEEAYLCRAWTMIIYAHCDQLIKELSKNYLLYLSSNPRQNYDYQMAWFAFYGKESVQHNSDKRYLLCKDASEASKSTRIKELSHKEVIDGGNFKYGRLRFMSEWVLQIDLDHVKYKLFYHSLKTKRDQIAHGENITVDYISDCLAWHEKSIELIDEISDKTLDFASSHAI
ncbi:hypothetical protein LGR54_02250 [Ancylobacter sp. Lp-2]|uniref:MAE_28990/MAE_18760 family HEPN-like nuclease n=1 Tax=Ancylobacter sp. Lp-2 TaxID=2881339 RepID=UPI001E417550|nr:MAE_28990/MAE_18760 family HEPN-like nuclease [Ancylobacter sp. Lp-2]MCB4767414.1 hypothetical protein [Ancylobacter sp. Lp-2]